MWNVKKKWRKKKLKKKKLLLPINIIDKVEHKRILRFGRWNNENPQILFQWNQNKVLYPSSFVLFFHENFRIKNRIRQKLRLSMTNLANGKTRQRKKKIQNRISLTTLLHWQIPSKQIKFRKKKLNLSMDEHRNNALNFIWKIGWWISFWVPNLQTVTRNFDTQRIDFFLKKWETGFFLLFYSLYENIFKSNQKSTINAI